MGKRDYIKEAWNGAQNQSLKLQNVRFKCCFYNKLDITDNGIIYCDPPYKDLNYYNIDFNHLQFWDWVREKSKTNKIFVSEYTAPDDFKMIWQKFNIRSSLSKNISIKINTEKLFIHKSSTRPYRATLPLFPGY